MPLAPSRPVVRLELRTGDGARARAFYGALWGWTAHPAANGGWTLDLGGVVGTIVESTPARPLWLPWVEVPDAHRATSEAWRLGATVVGQPRPVPGGWRSDIATPSGGRIIFWQPEIRR